MKYAALLALSVPLGLLLTISSRAAETNGTAAEAKAMLERGVSELKTDQSAAIAKFNDPKGGFRDRDLYIFCADRDGKIIAHPTLKLGTDMRSLKDKSGTAFGEELYAAAKVGEINEVSYMWPKPNSTEPVAKVSYMTRVGNALCGVGYYK
jgi:signal transduction histidine kinase